MLKDTLYELKQKHKDKTELWENKEQIIFLFEDRKNRLVYANAFLRPGAKLEINCYDEKMNHLGKLAGGIYTNEATIEELSTKENDVKVGLSTNMLKIAEQVLLSKEKIKTITAKQSSVNILGENAKEELSSKEIKKYTGIFCEKNDFEIVSKTDFEKNPKKHPNLTDMHFMDVEENDKMISKNIQAEQALEFLPINTELPIIKNRETDKYILNKKTQIFVTKDVYKKHRNEIVGNKDSISNENE